MLGFYGAQKSYLLAITRENAKIDTANTSVATKPVVQ